MKKFLIFGLGIVVAIAGTYFISNYKATPAPDNNQNITIKPSGPSDVGGTIDYTKNLKKEMHDFITTENTYIPGSTTFNGGLSEITSAGVSGGVCNYGSIAHDMTMAPMFMEDFGEGIVAERITYSTSVKIDSDTERGVSYFDKNTFANTFEMGTVNYWYNGQKVTYEGLSSLTTQGYYSVGCHLVVDYENETFDVHHYIVLLETGTYKSADGSIVLQLLDQQQNSSFTNETGSMFTFSYGNLDRSFAGDKIGGFAFGFGAQDAQGNYNRVEIDLTDYNKLSYNGIALTLDTTVA